MVKYVGIFTRKIKLLSLPLRISNKRTEQSYRVAFAIKYRNLTN